MKQNLLKSPENRIIIALLLFFVLIGLCVYYNTIYEPNSKYSSTKSILTNNPEGEIVFISGDFLGTYNGGFYILDNFENKKTIYKIKSSYNASNGDIISVLGILRPSLTITPQQLVINKKWKEDFILYRSALIGIILILLFFKYWKFDFRKIQFYRRK